MLIIIQLNSDEYKVRWLINSFSYQEWVVFRIIIGTSMQKLVAYLVNLNADDEKRSPSEALMTISTMHFLV